MINVKSAVSAAVEAAKGFYDNNKVQEFLLEEVEKSADEKAWLITLSFYMPTMPNEKITPGTPFAALSALTFGKAEHYERRYKTFAVDIITGEVKSMKMRAI